MKLIRTAWGRNLARLRDDEAGFTLVEVTVAITVIFASLVALAYTATIGFSYEDLARQKQTATGIANQMMEQVRGLAWDKITTAHVGADLGATRSDLTVTNPDSGYLVTGCSGDSAGVYRLFSCAAGSQIGSGEKVVASALSCAAGSPDCVSPLVRHAGEITQNNIVYTWRVYDSNNCPTGTTTGCTAATPYRVTVVVTWTGGKPSPNKIVQVQSLFWSPSGCRSTATHPFAAPCQPFFFGASTAHQSTVDISGSVERAAGATLPGPGELHPVRGAPRGRGRDPHGGWDDRHHLGRRYRSGHDRHHVVADSMPGRRDLLGGFPVNGHRELRHVVGAGRRDGRDRQHHVNGRRERVPAANRHRAERREVVLGCAHPAGRTPVGGTHAGRIALGAGKRDGGPDPGGSERAGHDPRGPRPVPHHGTVRTGQQLRWLSRGDGKPGGGEREHRGAAVGADRPGGMGRIQRVERLLSLDHRLSGFRDGCGRDQQHLQLHRRPGAGTDRDRIGRHRVLLERDQRLQFGLAHGVRILRHAVPAGAGRQRSDRDGHHLRDDQPGGDQQVAGIRERQGDRRHGPGHGTHRDDHLRGRARRQCGAAGRRSHDHRQPERVGGQRVLRGRTDIEFVDMRGGIMARINRRSRSERGMTLVEVLVAMAIMSIVLLVFTSVLGSVQSGVAHPLSEWLHWAAVWIPGVKSS